MTTCTANVTLLTSEELAKLVVERFPSAKATELAWGLPYLDCEGCLCLEIAFTDECGRPEDWVQKPLAVRQYARRAEVEELLMEDT